MYTHVYYTLYIEREREREKIKSRGLHALIGPCVPPAFYRPSPPQLRLHCRLRRRCLKGRKERREWGEGEKEGRIEGNGERNGGRRGERSWRRGNSRRKK
jgi:hypothetical protein